MSKYLTKTQILGIGFRKTEVEVPNLGTILIRELSAAEQEEYARTVLNSEGKPDLSKAKAMNAKLMAMACIDEADNPMFTPDDIPAINNLPGVAVKAVGRAILELSGMAGDSPTEDSEKNLEPARNGASLSV